MDLLFQAHFILEKAGDYPDMNEHHQLLEFVDIIKVDIMAYEGDLGRLVQQMQPYSVKLLAEEVETHGQFELCKRIGFDFFQGHFLCQPALLVDSRALDSNKGRLLELMGRVLEAEAPGELEKDISHDISFSYKLLCYINSAAIGLRRKVDSIGHALSLLGLDNIRIWISRLLVVALSNQKPASVLTFAFSRGRFLELLALARGEDKKASDYAVLGMFSLLDVMLEMPLKQALAPVSLPNLVRDGLFRQDSVAAERLKLICALEKADWSTVSKLALSLDLEEEELAPLYRQSVRWADEQNALMNSI